MESSTLVDSTRAPGPAAVWTVRVVAVAGRAVELAPVELAPGTLTVGRDVESRIPLADPRVSRLHAELSLSRNGTLEAILRGRSPLRIDGTQVEHATLRDGAHVVIGASALVVRHRASLPPDPSANLGILGDAPATRLLRRMIRMVAATDSTVLILGESGSGKELVARALHDASRRRGPLVAVNTSAIATSLAEAHLFGHVAGAYTGATSAAAGLFRSADGGTLFLDELADLAPELQPKLLRVLEDRVVVPVGATKGIPIDTRVVCATNRDLLSEVDAQRFRGDLYARLSDFTLRVAPLRERVEDVLLLLGRDLGPGAPPMSPELVAALLHHPWRFNVRELRKVAMQLRIRGAEADQLTLEMADLDVPVRVAPDVLVHRSSRPPPTAPRDALPVPTQEELERLLSRHRGVLEFVARETGRSRRQVHRWLEKYAIDVERYRVR